MRENIGSQRKAALLAVVALCGVVALVAAAVMIPAYYYKKTDPGPIRPIEREVIVRTESTETVEPMVEETVAPEPAEEPAPDPETEPVTEEPATPPVVAPAAPPATVRGSRVVTIDAGHQGRGSSTPEPIGPGATETKARVTSGTSGRATRVPEHQVNLEVAHLLKRELEARGITVVMVRETPNVDISNSERAKIGNDAGSDLVIRLHCDGSNDTSVRGILTLVPASNQWTGPIVDSSRRAGDAVHRSVLAATGARDRGVIAVGNMTGFNWSTVPTVIVEMGVMTNAEDDRLLSSPDYQLKLAQGMADGAVSYLQ